MDDYGRWVEQTTDGGYVITGEINSRSAGSCDAWLIKTDKRGVAEWEKTYGGSADDWGCSGCQTKDGGYIVAGTTESYGHGEEDVYLVKTNRLGEVEWMRAFGGFSEDKGRCIEQTAEGGYIVTGMTGSKGAGLGDLWLIKTDGGGNLQWDQTYGNGGYDEGCCVTQTSDGAYVVFGFAGSFDAQGYDFWLLKTAGGIGSASDTAQPGEQPGPEDPQDGARDWETEFYRVAKGYWPTDVLGLYPHRFAEVLVDDPCDLVVLRFDVNAFRDLSGIQCIYFAWSRKNEGSALQGPVGDYWYTYHVVTPGRYRMEIEPYRSIAVPQQGIVLIAGPAPSAVIAGASLRGKPYELDQFTHGDLWFSTWADDDSLLVTWGDGYGVRHCLESDCGLARLTGTLPNLAAAERRFSAPTAVPDVGDKPSGLLFMDGVLHGAFHTESMGFLAFSRDYGTSWTRVGFYEPGKGLIPDKASPWLKSTDSHFVCPMFVNKGRNHGLSADGFVYALGIQSEYGGDGKVYCARVPRERILDYSAYQYLKAETPVQWSGDQREAKALDNVWMTEMGSAMYHPGVGRYLLLSRTDLFDAPNPWGPWTYARAWGRYLEGTAWYGGYMPGIIPKDSGPNTFWFTIAGSHESAIGYELNLGEVEMQLRQ